MALFGIKRYVENEEQDETIKAEILQQLQNKIAAKRKKTHEQQQQQIIINDEKQQQQMEVKMEENAEKLAPINKKLHLEAENTFEIIGEDMKQQKLKIDMVLPAWLAHPQIIDGNNLSATNIANLTYLDEELRQVLINKFKLTQLFPVQQTVIPWLLQSHQKPLPFRPRDICVSAPTGSGKTLAFAIPVVQLLSARVEKQVRALIVLPVAELALQIFKVFLKLTSHTQLTVQLLSKQTPFHKEQQQLVELQPNGKYASKVDIIVTTPGRLIDHLHATKGFSLHALQFLVIDEADRIIDAAFQNWLQHYDMHMGSYNQSNALNFNNLLMRATQPHKLLFSATLTQDPEKLQRLRLFHPILFSAIATDLQALRQNIQQSASAVSLAETKTTSDNAVRFVTPKELTEKYCITESATKPLTLYALIQQHKWRKFLCFTNSAESSERLAFVLNKLANNQLKFEQLSAILTAKGRANMLNALARGKIDGLVCSDALARGIDVAHVDVIVSYDLPRHIKTYIHRIGRTARAGRPGTAVTLLTENQLHAFKKLLAPINKQLGKENELARSPMEEQFGASYAKTLKLLQIKLSEDQRKKVAKERMIKQSNILQQKSAEPKTLMEQLQAQLDTHNPFETR